MSNFRSARERISRLTRQTKAAASNARRRCRFHYRDEMKNERLGIYRPFGVPGVVAQRLTWTLVRSSSPFEPPPPWNIEVFSYLTFAQNLWKILDYGILMQHNFQIVKFFSVRLRTVNLGYIASLGTYLSSQYI